MTPDIGLILQTHAYRPSGEFIIRLDQLLLGHIWNLSEPITILLCYAELINALRKSSGKQLFLE